MQTCSKILPWRSRHALPCAPLLPPCPAPTTAFHAYLPSCAPPFSPFSGAPPSTLRPNFIPCICIMPGQALYKLRNKHEGADFIALALALQVLHVPRPVASTRQRCATGWGSTLYWDCLASATAPLGNHRHLAPYLESSSLETTSTNDPFRGAAANSSENC